MQTKKVLGAILAFFAAAAVFSLEVDRGELQSAGSADTIVFKNYSGPHSVINTIQEIRQIGGVLGEPVRANPTQAMTVGSANRYSVIHAIDITTTEKLDADIFIIGKGATVDHITNLRRIISGYLVSAYGYTERDADTIATFVTVYNAVYRGNMSVFESKYKKIVLDNISASKVGLETDYRDWPGNTQIVIPLSDIAGGLSTIDTSVISDKQVVKSMQGEDDKGIDTRKDMVDIKEREADNAQEKADEAQKTADAEKAKLIDEQKKSAQAQKDADKAQKDADAAKKNADAAQKDADAAQKNADQAQKDADAAKKNAEAHPNDAQAQQDAADAQKNADAAQKDADAAQQNADQAQSDAEQAQKDADQAQKDADSQAQKTEEQAQAAQNAQNEANNAQATSDQKRSEAQAERASIAKDQQSLIENSAQGADENTIFGLKTMDEQGTLSAIVRMNAATGALVKESPVSLIRGRTVYEDGNGFIAIAGANGGNGAIRLVVIDKTSLEIASESADLIAENSMLVQKDGSYFCVIQDGANCFLGKFNNAVETLVKSPVAIKGATPITIGAKGILVTDASGNPILLNPNDLTQIK